MRIAIVSDIHGNRAAFEAVLTDLKETSADLVLHAGDLADSGSSPAEIVDHIRDLGWNGVLGNTDEMHSRPESLNEFVSQSAAPTSLWAAVREMAAETHARLGDERIAWLRTLPCTLTYGSVAVVHASPENLWQSPRPESSDDGLKTIYNPLGRPNVVFGRIHRSFVRSLRYAEHPELIFVNSGSVGLPYDGDPRAAYVLIEDSKAIVRRVEYDVEEEVNALAESCLPHWDWVARMLRSGSPQLP